MHPGEIPEIVEIEQDSYKFPYSAELFQKCFDYGLFCRVIRSMQYKDILGYAIMSIHEDHGHIHNVTVRKNWRNLGIGKKLMDDLLNQPLVEFRLEVNPNNESAIKLYEKLGFEQTGIEQHYYDDGESALVFTINKNEQGSL